MPTRIKTLGRNSKQIGLKIALPPDPNVPKPVAKLGVPEIIDEIEDLLVNNVDCDGDLERSYELMDRLRKKVLARAK